MIVLRQSKSMRSPSSFVGGRCWTTGAVASTSHSQTSATPEASGPQSAKASTAFAQGSTSQGRAMTEPSHGPPVRRGS